MLALHRAVALAIGEKLDDVAYCEQLLNQWTERDLNPPPLVTGEDLKRLGLRPGKIFKDLLEAVRNAQLDGTITTKLQAEALVRELLQERGIT